MNELKFNSQICTTKIQSQRLLDLGLNPYTSDMCWLSISDVPSSIGYIDLEKVADELKFNIIPAWSLHRLIKMLPSEIKQIDWYYDLTFRKDIIQYEDYDIDVLSFGDNPCLYDNIVDCIEWLIKEKYFNKEYLKQ